MKSVGRSGIGACWLREALATYESRQARDPKRFDYVLKGNYPSLDEMNQSMSSWIYDLGYDLMDFIVQERGPEAIRQLVLNPGDFEKILGMSRQEFEDQWHHHIEVTHLGKTG